MSADPGFSGMPQIRPAASARGPHISAFPPKSHSRVVRIEQLPQRPVASLGEWSGSYRKRLFDIATVCLALPVVLPVLLLTGVAVRLTSRGPVLFRQQRMGRDGKTFMIFKFRTMPVRRSSERPAVTTAVNQKFTPVGSFLRRWKLDELPQLLNILRGDMSLVGPRPKILEHQSTPLSCRPGITGYATIIFALEEVALSKLPHSRLDSYYDSVVLPLKQMMDDDYMANATFISDARLIIKSVFRNWDDLAITDLPSLEMHFARFFGHSRIPTNRISKTSEPAVSGSCFSRG